MKLKILLSGIVYTLIGALLLVQTNLVLAIASDPNNPITAAITSAITGDSNSNPEPTTQPTPTPEPETPITTPITNPSPSQAPITTPIVNPSPTSSPAPTPTPQPTNNGTQYNLGVLVLKYFPLASNGQNIDVNTTGDVSESYSLIRQRTIDVTNNLLSVLPKASTYLGYKEASASPSLNYNIVATKEFTTAVPTINKVNKLRYPDYKTILSDRNICNYVDNQNVREVWLWAYQGPNKADGQPSLNISESKMSSPYGDISNSPRYNEMPVCNYTYRVYTFNYGRGTAEALESWSHQLESELAAYDWFFFRNIFQGPARPQAIGAIGRCGSAHNPPNARHEYDRNNPNPQQSDCLDLNADPENLGPISQISCSNWGCQDISDTNNSSLNYMIWNWQNLPGKNNQKSYKGAILRNLWDIHGDFDNVMSSLYPIVNTPTAVIPVVNNIFPNPATQGTIVTLTGSGFTNASKVYVNNVLMPIQFYTVSEDGKTLTFNLDSEANFIAGQVYNIVITNGKTNSNSTSITIAPSVIQTIPAISSAQILVAPSVSLDTNRPQVVLASSNFNTTINIPLNVSNPTLSFSNLLTTSATQTSATFNNIVNINSSTSVGNVTVKIPALTKIVGPINWDGVINAPKILASNQASPVADSGTNVTTQSVIEVGIGDIPLTFNKAVRLLIPNQAGKLVGYQRGTTFTKITQNCSADSQSAGDSLSANGDCYINVGTDLVIWTKHFTKFATYTQSSNSTSSSSSSNSSTSNTYNPACTDTKPQSAPKLLSAKATGRNQITLNWSKALDPVSYYLIAYGTKSGKLEYGNPNIGDKNTTSYVVKGLNNNQTYYFKIRAGNNCTPGEFSNEIAVKASGDNITSPARGFKAEVLSIQNQKTSLNTELKFKPITSANPQRALDGSSNLVSKFINFISQIFKKS